MDDMTTYRALLDAQGQRLRANKSALLLPLLAVETFGIASHLSWVPVVLVPATLAITLLAPSRAARITPYATIGYGLLGFLVVHSLMKQETGGNPGLLSPSG